jgi:hypothetical protein
MVGGVLLATGKIAAIAIILFASSSVTKADPSEYICYGEHAVGLRYDGDTRNWNESDFTHHKYIFRRLTDDDRSRAKGKLSTLLNKHPNANWAFFEFGVSDPVPLSECEYADGALAQDVACHRIIDDGAFNKDSRRFEISFRGSYITQGFWEQLRLDNPETYELLLSQGDAENPAKPNDLFIEIGRCKPVPKSENHNSSPSG